MENKVSFAKCTHATLVDVPYQEGQIIFVTDTKRLYFDMGEQRVVLRADGNGSHFAVSPTPPVDLNTGDMWFITETLPN